MSPIDDNFYEHVCTICGNSWRDPQELANHMLDSHPGHGGNPPTGGKTLGEWMSQIDERLEKIEEFIRMGSYDPA